MSDTSDPTAVRPFTFDIPDSELDGLRDRILATRWPEEETVKDQSQGTPFATLRALAQYWASEYDWRKVEAKLKALPHFVTEIDGLDIHFIHVRSKHEDALPLLVTHGWPGSVIEQLKIIEPLADPTAHGGDASDAFHLVVPSMPGYGFSGKPSEPGWNPERMARAWGELMKRLGYTRYAAQGGDWGAIVTDIMGVQEPEGLIGIHTNMANAVPPAVMAAIEGGDPVPDDVSLSPEENEAVEQLRSAYADVPYAYQMGTAPQTLAGLVDSPVGLAAFMLDHDWQSLEMISRSFAGEPEGLTRDDVLDNITLFWLTKSAVSAARLYWETAQAGISFFGAKGVRLPVAASVFPTEMYRPPKSWAEKAYPNLIHYNRVPEGGHFAAWEQPGYFVDEVRTGLRPLRG
ncbi:epoxide hydrolase family protein [Streptomyces wuyuanensis]|uniref:Pimeloyl-ACP methyl ester carboxylesterase n=1 Tax=Streptomyces wuyuanensis TaxID=1196353 RepID=A0A1H0CTL9_9ACTN|nr:epoxide hydrolase family protein [Streptomyces wuyuanensis]SDN61238.1 Pimeloyl-ACP methyl ester carboxylesterase [Streptomyces wuyuanensis]